MTFIAQVASLHLGLCEKQMWYISGWIVVVRVKVIVIININRKNNIDNGSSNDCSNCIIQCPSKYRLRLHGMGASQSTHLPTC